MALSYFSKIVLENIWSFISIDGVYKIIVWNSHYSESEKIKERLRYKVDNL